MEMYQIVNQSASEKPDETMVSQIEDIFKAKHQNLKQTMANKFKEFRAKLKVKEQIVDAILKKNLLYLENGLKGLKSVDYSMFNDADKWMKNAKKKLDNFQANNQNPHYIAFDMLANAKQPNDEFNDIGGDNLLMDDEQKSMDVIVHGEKIADFLGQVKTINPNLLMSQLNQLNLQFNDKLFDEINSFVNCTSIEGVEVSQEELEALQEAANAG